MLGSILALSYPRFTASISASEPYPHTAMPTSSAVILSDATHYANAVSYFKGDGGQLVAPYAYRIIPLYAASKLPFNPIKNINVLNIFYYSLAYLLLIINNKKNIKSILLNSILFCVSFPVFYYLCIGLVDPLSILIISAILLSQKKSLITLIFLFLLAPFINEKIVLCLIPCVYYRYHALQEGKFSRHFLLPLVIGIVYFYLCSKWLRGYIGTDIDWAPNWTNLMINIQRPRAWISAILTIAPQIAAIIFLRNRLDKNSLDVRAHLLGALLFLLLWIYSFVAAWTDGRFLWYSYPYLFSLVGLAYLRTKPTSLKIN